MEYALIDIEDRKHLVHVNEIMFLEQSNELIEVAPFNMGKTNIVLGTYMPRQGVSIEGASEMLLSSIKQNIGEVLIYIWESKCFQVLIIDIELKVSDNDKISFSALVEGELVHFKNTISLFNRDDSGSIKKSILSREGIFSLELKIEGNGITQGNWKAVVDRELDNYEQDREPQRLSYQQAKEYILEEVPKKKYLNSDTLYSYDLTHTYNIEDTTTRFTSSIEPDTMEILIAYIQFIAAEIDPHVSMLEENVVEIISRLYDKPRDIKDCIVNPYEIDLYINWERWCFYSNIIESIELFKHPGLQPTLHKILLDESNEA